jgi:histidinol-phosphate aminotransferase
MSYFRSDIDALTGYVPGEQPQTEGFIKLNTNENPYPPSPRVLEAIRACAGPRLRLYPDPVARRFCETAGDVLGVSPDSILACNGSDDALTILTRACLAPGDTMVAPQPSYGLYSVLAEIQGARFRRVPWQADGSLPPDFTDGARLAYITNPNAPTGSMISPQSIRAIAEKASCLVVADEAYADFAPHHSIGLVASTPNLVVTRTLSKSYSLAGIRFGFVVASPAVIATLMKVKDSYNCDAISIAAACAALSDRAYFEETLGKILATRRRLEPELSALGFRVTPSNANFVWFQHDQPVEPIYRKLKEQRILIRYFRYSDGVEGLRVTVGTDDEIDAFLTALRSMV